MTSHEWNGKLVALGDLLVMAQEELDDMPSAIISDFIQDAEDATVLFIGTETLFPEALAVLGFLYNQWDRYDG